MVGGETNDFTAWEWLGLCDVATAGAAEDVAGGFRVCLLCVSLSLGSAV